MLTKIVEVVYSSKINVKKNFFILMFDSKRMRFHASFQNAIFIAKSSNSELFDEDHDYHQMVI